MLNGVPHAQCRTVADQLRPKGPRLATLMDAAGKDVLAFMNFPAAHRETLHSTNPIERCNGEIKRRTDGVGRFPNEAAVRRQLVRRDNLTRPLSPPETTAPTPRDGTRPPPGTGLRLTGPSGPGMILAPRCCGGVRHYLASGRPLVAQPGAPPLNWSEGNAMAERDQVDGDLPGTSVFNGVRSRQGYRLNKFAMSLADPLGRERFLADEVAYMEGMGLTGAEIGMVRRRDWAAMIEGGGNLYVILKIAGTVGQNLLQMGSQMRGETLEQFMATLPGAGRH